MMDKKQTSEKDTPSQPFRILSLDGGGVRGIFQAVYLSTLLSKLDVPVSRCFDLIAGTSTGAIVGLALGLGVDPPRIVDFYKNHARQIFDKRWLHYIGVGTRYNQTPLRECLRDLFGANQLKDASTKMLITAVSIDQFAHRVFSSSPKESTADGRLSAVEVALASAAAPTYFDPVKPADQQRTYVDGGLWANSPSSLAVLFAHRDLDVPLSAIRLLSVGTGHFPMGVTPGFFTMRRPIRAIRLIFELMFSSQASYADEYAQHLVGYQKVLRVSPLLDEVIPLDAVEKSIRKLPPLAEASAESSLKRVRELLLSEIEMTADEKPQTLTFAPRHLIESAGLSAIYPSRNFYSAYRQHAASMDLYVNSAQKSVVVVSINLMTGLPFDGLAAVLEKKLEDRDEQFTAVVSLLNPDRQDLMTAMAPVLDMQSEELSTNIEHILKRLLKFRQNLSSSGKERFEIRVHHSIPFASAILLDHHETSGRIQIETKPYKAPVRKSFALEIVPTGTEGLFESLVKGYEELLKDGNLYQSPPDS